MNPPADISTWIGSLLLTAAGGVIVTRFLTRGDKAEEAFKAEVKADLKLLIQGQTNLVSDLKLQARDITQLQQAVVELKESRIEQAKAHKEAIAMLREEFKK